MSMASSLSCTPFASIFDEKLHTKQFFFDQNHGEKENELNFELTHGLLCFLEE
jgi:hypothetical protein